MASPASDSFSDPSSSQTSKPDLATRASEAASAVKERVRNLAGDEIVDQASDAVLELKDQVSGQAYDLADEGLQRGAAGIESVAQAVHGAAKDFEKSLPQAAGMIHHAADQLERASNVVRNSSIEDVAGMVDDFARRQPVAFFGAAVLAGFVLTRFVKSSAGYHGAQGDKGFPPRHASREGV
jgi:hypothetical protein